MTSENRRVSWRLVLFAVSGSMFACSESDGQVSVSTLSWVGDTVAVIGALDGEDYETFGRLWRAEARESNGVYLFDLQRGAIFSFTFDGQFRDGITAHGQGPGELQQPMDFHVDASGSVWVLDPGNARISRFSWQGAELRFADAMRTELTLGTICTVNGRLFHSLLSEGQVLHEIGASGEPVRSMGPAPHIPELEPLGAYRSRAEAQILEGMVHCDDDIGVVLVAFSSYPLVQAFELDGYRRWAVELPEVFSVGFQLTDDGWFRGQIDSETGAHFLRSLVPWGESSILLQFETRFPGEPSEGREFHGIDSRLLDLRTGRELERRTDMPWVGARAGDHLVLLENIPYPRALVVEVH